MRREIFISIRHIIFYLNMVKVCVGLMAGTAQAKYRELIHGCCRTWIQDYSQLNEDVYLFCGEHKDYGFEAAMNHITDGHAKFFHIKGVKDDYISASIKQWYGLGYMRQNVVADFYVIIGTDNYVNKNKLEMVTGNYLPDYPCMIGGYTEVRNVGFVLSFHLGGGGLAFSRGAVDELLLSGFSNYIDGANNIMKTWLNLCSIQRNGLECACDVSAAYLCWMKGIATIKEKSMYPCSFSGKFCNPDMNLFPLAMDHENIAVCHYMTYNDMLIYRNYLKNDNVMSYIKFIRFYQTKILDDGFKNNKWIKSIIHHPNDVLIVGDDDGNILYHIIMDWLSYHSDEPRTVTYTDISISKLNKIKDICKNLTGIYIYRNTNLLNKKFDIVFYNSLHCYGNLKKILNNVEKTCNRTIVIFGTEVFDNKSEFYNLNVETLSDHYNIPSNELIEGMSRAIDEFITDNENWVEDIYMYMTFVTDSKLNNIINPLIDGGVLFLNNINYLPKIYDISIYCIEKDILKLRLKELYDHVSEFILL